LNKKLKGITVFRTIFFTPVVISFVAIGAVWTWIYNPTQGMLNHLLGSTGLMNPKNPIAWLGDPRYALISIMIVDIWKWIGYHVVLFLAGLQTISNDLYEAASIDGANSFQTMMRITIPQIKNVFYINLTFCLVGAFNVFDVVMVMTKGGPYGKTEVIAKYIYDTSFGSTNMFGYATAISIFVFILMLIVTLVILKLMRKSEEDM
jgi:ABC-type sugar transport system permease subunit